MARTTTRTRGRVTGYALASTAMLTSAIALAGTPVASTVTTHHKVNIVAATAIEYAVDGQARAVAASA